MEYVIDKIESKNNNFDFLRFFAASLVIVSHSFPLSGSKFEPFSWLSGFYTLGGLALVIFFTMSGFLIVKSWTDYPDYLNFAKKRFLRIIPGLVVVTFFSILVIGPLVTVVNLDSYFQSRQIIDYLKNVFMFPMYDNLPGVFVNNIYPNAVNGSLHTIPVEIVMYGMVVIFGILGVFRNKLFPVAIVLILLIMDFHVLPRMNTGNQSVFFHPIVSFFWLATYFAIGSCFYIYREKIPYDKIIAFFALIMLLLSFKTPAAQFVGYFAFPYLVIYLSFLDISWLRNFSKYGDFSYGLYIYAFPVQQTIMHFSRNKINIVYFFLISYAITLIFACISWNIIEKPFLNLKKKRIRRWLFEERVAY